MSRSKTLPIKETHIQQAFISWIRQTPDPRTAYLYAVMNGGRRSKQAAQRAIAEGLLAGIADVHLPYPNGKDPGLFLEFKTPRGSQTKTQKNFQRWCDWVGYPYMVVRSPDEAVYTIEDYLTADTRQLGPPPIMV